MAYVPNQVQFVPPPVIYQSALVQKPVPIQQNWNYNSNRNSGYHQGGYPQQQNRQQNRGNGITYGQKEYLKNNKVPGHFTHPSKMVNPHDAKVSPSIIPSGYKKPTVDDIYNIISIVLGEKHPFNPNEKYLNRYINAFTHASYVAECKNKTGSDIDDYDLGIKLIPSGTYQRLEWFGDAFLQLVVSEYIYSIFKKSNEGFLTKLRSKLVKGEACVEYANYLGLAKWIFLSAEVEFEQNGRENPKILEDVFEAFVGALALEFGIDLVRNFIIKIIHHFYPNPEEDLAHLMDAKNDDNYKDIFLRECQANQWPQPKYIDIYEKKLSDGTTREFCVMTFLPNDPSADTWKYPIVKEDDPEYVKKFRRMCKNMDVSPHKGYGPTKKKAQQEASRIALEKLANLKRKRGLVMQKVKIVVIDSDIII